MNDFFFSNDTWACGSVRLFAVILTQICMISRSYLYGHQVMWLSVHCTYCVIVSIAFYLWIQMCISIWLITFLFIHMPVHMAKIFSVDMDSIKIKCQGIVLGRGTACWSREMKTVSIVVMMPHWWWILHTTGEGFPT